MGLKDKLTGRLKQAAGDLKGDEALRRQGADEERKAEAQEELDAAQDEAADQAVRVQDAERAVEDERRSRG
jgi:uncharacterized protein YjbJ (UPF0337 family)